MPSALTWTIGWGAYFVWMIKELKETRTLEYGYFPIHLSNSLRLKEQYLRALKLSEKYSEELDSVDKENPSADDIEKFQLTKPSHGMAFWTQFKTNPHWRKVDAQVRAEVRKTMLDEHPDYAKLIPAMESGGYKALFGLEGPWGKAGYDDGLRGAFDGYDLRIAHHAHHDDHGHGAKHH